MVQTFMPPSHGAQRIYPESAHPETEKSVVMLPTRDLEISVAKLKAAAQEQDTDNFAYLQQIIANNINKETAINILIFLEKEVTFAANGKPSAPPESPTVESKTKQYMLDNMDDLRNACLNVIDTDVHGVLSDDVLPTLPYDILHEILSRDTLNNPREDLLFKYIWIWAYSQCEDTTKMKSILRDLPNLIRYGLMSWASFKKLKYEIRIVLDLDDYKSIKSYLQQRKKCLKVTSLPNNWSKTRKNQTDNSYGEAATPPNCFIKCCVGWAFLFD